MKIMAPSIQVEGFGAMMNGRSMKSGNAPMGFAFCPYKLGSTERYNWLFGACIATFGEAD